ncbi:hypothetical protein QYF61_018299 [Mycteria americana]|uniref:Reverse transcriptase domain-containing protein n=1 Tax=Mycteria americana TaxID=33587 RepID=A0AAN7RR47_MYCAM|nr:hypothetical protein QYF61_018299 [Mycteria americana]
MAYILKPKQNNRLKNCIKHNPTIQKSELHSKHGVTTWKDAFQRAGTVQTVAIPWRTMLKQRLTLQPVDHPNARAGGCALKEAAACGEPTQEQAPGRSCSPWKGACMGADLLAEPAACGGSRLEQSVPEGLHPVEGTHTGAILEELQPMRRTHIGEVCEGLDPMGGTPCWSRRRSKMDDPRNYRLVSLISILGKVREQILIGATYKHIIDKKVIWISQHGFMRGKSCLTNLTAFYDKMTW